MRVILGLLALATSFLLARSLQARWTDGVRQEREAMRENRRLPGPESFETWGRARIVLGRSSGKEPLDVPLAAELAGTHSDLLREVDRSASALDEGAPPQDWDPPIYEMTVQRGQVLSVICQDFYGTSRPPLPERVALFNGLADVDSLRAGQRLRLPPLSMLRDSEP